MSTALEKYKNMVNGKTVAVIGLGVSNQPLIKQLISLGAKVVARDRKKDALAIELKEQFEAEGVKFILGEEYLDGLCEDIIFRTPGLKCYDPHLIEADEKGCKITSEMQLFFELCPCPIFAVTGSDGKTTTTTLIYEMLTKQGFNCYKGGNIGAPLLPKIGIIKPTDIAVIELSSFQLQDMKNSPDVAVITNLSPNHLDYHANMEEYVNAKANIFLHQHRNDRLVYNYDNAVTREIVIRNRKRGTAFGKTPHGTRSVYLKDGSICYSGHFREEKIVDIDKIRIPGAHNVENYMAAIAAVMDYVDIENMVYVAENFGGVEHRIEFVREYNGVRYYNDSIASSPTRSAAGLRSFEQKLVLIAGGYDKNLDYTDLGVLINEKVKKLVLVGATSEKIYNAVVSASNYKDIIIERCMEFEEAITRAKEIAEKGDIVILSPASASFDMFKNFEVRGNTFKDIVNKF